MADPNPPGAGRRTPLDARAMRQGNLSLVLDAVVRQPSISQPELVELTGLKKPTVSQLLDELVRLGWVRLVGAAPGAIGRPRSLFAPAPDRGLVLSARISIEGISALAADFGGTARDLRSRPLDTTAVGQADVAAILGEMVADLLGEIDPGEGRVLGAALALSGIVDGGQLGYAPGLQWPDRDVTRLLGTALGSHLAADAPLLVGNEARLAALGEQRYGAAAGVEDFVYLLGDTGVGAGVVAGGRLFEGTRGAAGEVGHLSVALDGRRCSCGKVGCWASYVGRDELVRLAVQARDQGRSSSSWTDSTPGPLDYADVLAAARNGDAVALDGLAAMRRYLAAGIGNLVSAYDPELVVLGGFLATAFGDDLAGLREDVDDWVMGGGIYTRLRLETSQVTDAPLWGGVSLVHDRLVQTPRSV
jgi:predicted NBD/HSP70 family sugar kinase